MIKIVVAAFFRQTIALPINIQFFCAKKVQIKSTAISVQFTDKSIEENKDRPVTAGRSWKAEQLRIKSTEDLHKLWFVCVREKNLVLADQLAQEHDPTYQRKAGKIRRVQKLDQTMRRIMHVISERQQIKKQYRKKLQEEYIERKRAELQKEVAKQPEPLPEITFEMLRAKYHALRRGVDNVEYLEKLWKKKQENQGRNQRAEERVAKLDPERQFTSFWEYQTTIGERPTQNQVLKSHIKNWKSLNLKQRKIVLGFLNARRSKDAKSAFVSELKILGQKIAYEQAKSRNSESQQN